MLGDPIAIMKNKSIHSILFVPSYGKDKIRDLIISSMMKCELAKNERYSKRKKIMKIKNEAKNNSIFYMNINIKQIH